MKTRTEFIERWKRHVAGIALYGSMSELRDGPLTRAGKILEIPGEVERLLGQLYDDLAEKPALPNGAAQPQQKAAK